MPRRIILVGHLDYASGRELIEHCQRQRALGATALTLDLTGVVSCDEAGIDALVTLQEGVADLHIELSEPAGSIKDRACLGRVSQIGYSQSRMTRRTTPS